MQAFVLHVVRNAPQLGVTITDVGVDGRRMQTEPRVAAQACPACGGEVRIGLVGMARVGDGPENWVENGTCAVCGTRLVRELSDTDRPLVFMSRGSWHWDYRWPQP
jgi:hypothetical protein